MFSHFMFSPIKASSDKKISKVLSHKLKKFNDSELEKEIDEMLWKLRFNIYTKGTHYLKDALLICFIDESYLYDTNSLIQQLSIIHQTTPKNIRNCIDNTLNSAFKYEYLDFDIKFFRGYYDGRKISLKYFVNLATNYINQKEGIK